MIAGRDWLFGEFDAYVDTSHVINVIRFAVDLQDEDAIRLALELCQYGAHLSSQFKMRGEPPFEDIYRDYAIYLHAMLGEDLDAAIEHFQSKIIGSGRSDGGDPIRAGVGRIAGAPRALFRSSANIARTSDRHPSQPTWPAQRYFNFANSRAIRNG